MLKRKTNKKKEMGWSEGLAFEAGRTLLKVTFDWSKSSVKEAR